MQRKNTLNGSNCRHQRRDEEKEMLKTPSLRCLRDKLFLLALLACLVAFLFCFWRATQESESAAELAKVDRMGKIYLIDPHLARYTHNAQRLLNTYPAANTNLVDDRRENGAYHFALNAVRTSTVNAMYASLACHRISWHRKQIEGTIGCSRHSRPRCSPSC